MSYVMLTNIIKDLSLTLYFHVLAIREWSIYFILTSVSVPDFKLYNNLYMPNPELPTLCFKKVWRLR